jgi:hypothetical protein
MMPPNIAAANAGDGLAFRCAVHVSWPRPAALSLGEGQCEYEPTLSTPQFGPARSIHR